MTQTQDQARAVEGAIAWAKAEIARRKDAIIPAPSIETACANGIAANYLRTLLASHAAQAEEIARSEKHRNDLADKIVAQRTEIGALSARLAESEAEAKKWAEAARVNAREFNETFRKLAESEAREGALEAKLKACEADLIGERALHAHTQDELRMEGIRNAALTLKGRSA